MNNSTETELNAWSLGECHVHLYTLMGKVLNPNCQRDKGITGKRCLYTSVVLQVSTQAYWNPCDKF